MAGISTRLGRMSARRADAPPSAATPSSAPSYAGPTATEPVAETNGADDDTSDDEAGDEHWSLLGDEHWSLRQSVLARLGLEDDAGSVVLAPVLFCTLAALCGTPVGRVTGPMLASAFMLTTGRDLQAIRVMTRNGVLTMPSSDLADAFKRWALNLNALVNESNCIEALLGWAEACNSLYSRKYQRDAAGSTLSLNEQVALRILAEDNHEGRLLLGLGKTDIRWLYSNIDYIVGDNADAA
ncbi:hypothetical protein IWW57_004782 [Coemansia sp. S610]|nr:hypothetical protein IWW57_004782 [Coemansia sp. S610]